jgi:hypothetical protein
MTQMTRLLSTTALLTVAVIAAVAIGNATAAPSVAISQSFDLTAFTEADVQSDLSVAFVVGGPQSIAVEASSQAALDDLRLDVIGGKLYAWVENDFWDLVAVRGDDRIAITITVPSLDSLAASASADVEVSGMTGEAVSFEVSSSATLDATGLDVEAVRIDASSAGIVVLSGSCLSADVNVSSSALFNGKGFECTDVAVNASSAAQAVVFATGLVDANASSSATVLITGHPSHVDDDEDSGGDVSTLD